MLYPSEALLSIFWTLCVSSRPFWLFSLLYITLPLECLWQYVDGTACAMELQPGPAFDQLLNEGLFDRFDSWSISSDEMVGIIPSGSLNSGVPLSGFPQSFTVAPWDLTIVGKVAQPCSEFEEQSVPAISQPISIVATPPSQTSSSIVRSSEAEGTLSRKRNSH